MHCTLCGSQDLAIASLSFGSFQEVRNLTSRGVRTVKDIWLGYDIDYSNIACIVTDTEATMVKAVRIFVLQAEHEASQVSWHGCIDHLLNLITKIAFKDFAK